MENIQTTKDIKISVHPKYEVGHSVPKSRQYVFSYHIEIENLSKNNVQLLNRRWVIFQKADSKKIVEGPGVVGEQPILKPGEKYSYSSWCMIEMSTGYMRGTFEMINLENGDTFHVTIPQFQLIAPYKLN